MTATAFAFDPALDRFDDTDGVAPARPQLRLLEGGAYGQVPTPARLHALEIHRRRQFFALLAATVLILATAWAAGVSVTSFSGASGASTADAATVVHVVLPGDSYGAIAAELGVANPAVAGGVLRAANGGGDLVVGQRLVVQLTELSELTELAGLAG